MHTLWSFEVLQPLLMVVCLLLAKYEINELMVSVLCRAEWDHMLHHVQEVIMGIWIFACSETLKGKAKKVKERASLWEITDLVIFQVPLMHVWCAPPEATAHTQGWWKSRSFVCPLWPAGTGQKIHFKGEKYSMTYSDDGCHKLNQEVGDLQIRTGRNGPRSLIRSPLIWSDKMWMRDTLIISVISEVYNFGHISFKSYLILNTTWLLYCGNAAYKWPFYARHFCT